MRQSIRDNFKRSCTFSYYNHVVSNIWPHIITISLLAVRSKPETPINSNLVNKFLCSLLRASMLSHVQLFATPWAEAHLDSLSMEFSRQEHWSGLPFPPPVHLPDSGMELASPAKQKDYLPTEPTGKLSKGLQPIKKKEGDSRKKKYVCNSSMWESRVSQGGNGEEAGRGSRGEVGPGARLQLESEEPDTMLKNAWGNFWPWQWEKSLLCPFKNITAINGFLGWTVFVWLLVESALLRFSHRHYSQRILRKGCCCLNYCGR